MKREPLYVGMPVHIVDHGPNGDGYVCRAAIITETRPGARSNVGLLVFGAPFPIGRTLEQGGHDFKEPYIVKDEVVDMPAYQTWHRVHNAPID